MGAFFGELYLRSTLPFLRDDVTDDEAAFLRQRLPPGDWLDVGCGHGRHFRRLGPTAVGVDFDQRSLDEAKAFGPVARGDMRQLPFRNACFDGAYCWYNTLTTFDRNTTVQMAREMARCVRPGGVIVTQGGHPQRAIEQPHATWDGRLPDGSHLYEETHYSFERGQDEIERRLTLPDGRVLAASFFIRYYDLDEWCALLAEAGLVVQWSCGSVEGTPIGRDSAHIIVGAQTRG